MSTLPLAAISFADVFFILVAVAVVVLVFRAVRAVMRGTIRTTTKVVVNAAGESRPCPRCGRQVKVGMLDCADCGFDFRTIGDPGSAESA